MRRLRVLTPELVPLEYRIAGLPERAVAAAIDALIVNLGILILYVSGLVIGGAVGGAVEGLSQGAMILTSFVLTFGYRWWGEARWKGRTLGKRMLALRVLQVNGTPILPWQAFARNAVRIVDQLPIAHLVGVTCVLVEPKGRRVGDLLAGTVVIREVRTEPPPVPRALYEQQNSLLQDPGAASRIRSRLADREAVLLTEFVAASPRLDTVRRLKLAQRIARHYRGRLHLDAHAGLPDEVLLRGIVGVLLRDRFGRTARRR